MPADSADGEPDGIDADEQTGATYKTTISFASQSLSAVPPPGAWHHHRTHGNAAVATPPVRRPQGRAARVRTNHRRRGSSRQTRAGPDDDEGDPEPASRRHLEDVVHVGTAG